MDCQEMAALLVVCTIFCFVFCLYFFFFLVFFLFFFYFLFVFLFLFLDTKMVQRPPSLKESLEDWLENRSWGQEEEGGLLPRLQFSFPSFSAESTILRGVPWSGRGGDGGGVAVDREVPTEDRNDKAGLSSFGSSSSLTLQGAMGEGSWLSWPSCTSIQQS